MQDRQQWLFVSEERSNEKRRTNISLMTPEFLTLRFAEKIIGIFNGIIRSCHNLFRYQDDHS